MLVQPNDQEVIVPTHFIGLPSEPKLIQHPSNDPTHARFVMEHQLMSDWDGTYWLQRMWNTACSVEVPGDCLLLFLGENAALEITGCHVGAWGLQFLTFSITVRLDVLPSMDRKECIDWMEDVLSQYLVHDSDVECRWVSSVDGVN